MLFAGNYDRTLDNKNRIVMPPKLKTCLEGESIFLCHQPNESFLRAYKYSEWEKLAEKYLLVDNDDVDRSRIQRMIFLNGENCTFDGSGRFTVNPKFCKMVGIEKDVVMLGVGKRIEIWGKEVFEKNLGDILYEEPGAGSVFPY